jgi:hypothetical protein
MEAVLFAFDIVAMIVLVYWSVRQDNTMRRGDKS